MYTNNHDTGTVNAVNPGPVKTDMWGGTSEEFQGYLKPFIQKTPGSKIRKEVDDKDLVEDEQRAGGRPAYVGEIAGTSIHPNSPQCEKANRFPGVVGMLCTPDALWTTGQVVCANGGMRMAI